MSINLSILDKIFIFYTQFLLYALPISLDYLIYYCEL